ncbi:IS3 family transposase [Siminovitchia terrae]|uniref:IS3 family transposase n=1 Tax=Siminovitchia terrae TaxID=1914933 RepID=UPI001FE57918|nr:IS3 family transposase [Siminovitchia terrae]
MQAHQDEYSVVRMCEILGVSKSGYYNWFGNQGRAATEREKKREEIKQKISQFFHESYGTYGSPRIHDDLIEHGYVVSRKTVARLMKKMGLRAIPQEKYVMTTDSNHDFHIYPNLLNQEFGVNEPNKVWVTDITYVWTLEGWLYLASVIDLFSRKVVGWSQAAHMKKELAISALRMAITTRQPEEGLIHHSDRGSQYCSSDYIHELKELKAEISMSRKGNPYDNACIESFHATIKKELIYRRRFNTRDEATKAINYYISHFYNERRKHSAQDYRSPNNYERLYDAGQAQNIS